MAPGAKPVSAQTVPERIVRSALESAALPEAAEYLSDVIGPRLTGSSSYSRAVDWLVEWYRARGIDARAETWGRAPAWERGRSSLELIQPRYRMLEGMSSAWSTPMSGPVEGPVFALPAFRNGDDFRSWLRSVTGAFVLVTWPEPSCRTRDSWEASATIALRGAWAAGHDSVQALWQASLDRAGIGWEGLISALETAGAAGVILSQWSRGWGTYRVHRAPASSIPSFSVSCEDYGLLSRLAAGGHAPRVRAVNDAHIGALHPVRNVIAEIPGSDPAAGSVVLSAHLDSWDAGSGATDDGAGTVAVMEAMRILKSVDPAPRRTIIAGHWGGEEQGENGSRAFVEDHRGMLDGIQVVLNVDHGTGRVTRISMQGFGGAGAFVGRWLDALPSGIERPALADPGAPGDGGDSDQVPFLCHDVPAFYLEGERWDYGAYTWHSNRDTYDKLVTADLRQVAALVAVLAYEAAGDPEPVPRDHAAIPAAARVEACGAAVRSYR